MTTNNKNSSLSSSKKLLIISQKKVGDSSLIQFNSDKIDDYFVSPNDISLRVIAAPLMKTRRLHIQSIVPSIIPSLIPDEWNIFSPGHELARLVEHYGISDTIDIIDKAK